MVMLEHSRRAVTTGATVMLVAAAAPAFGVAALTARLYVAVARARGRARGVVA